EAEPTDVRQFNPQVPETLLQILRRMMAKQPADRYQTPNELLRDLLQKRERLPSASAHGLPEDTGQPVRRAAPTEPESRPEVNSRAVLAGLAQAVDEGMA